MIVSSPEPGYMRNPLKRVNRNIRCICDSGRKVKNCCGREKYVPISWGEQIIELFRELNKEEKLSIGLK